MSGACQWFFFAAGANVKMLIGLFFPSRGRAEILGRRRFPLLS